MNVPILREMYKRIPSCESCIYFIKNKNLLLSQCKMFQDKKVLAISCRLDDTKCGFQGLYYKPSFSKKN